MNVIGPFDNLQGVNTIGRQMAAADAERVLGEHGADPATRPQAAAHEAGHVIVAYTYGARISGARLRKYTANGRVVWLGQSHHELPGRASGLRTTAEEDPDYAFWCAIVAFAGIAGERVKGLHHPASSIDEKFMSAATCGLLAPIWGVPVELLAHTVESLCSEALSTNRLQFEVVQAHLNQIGQLNKSAARRLLARAQRFCFGDAIDCVKRISAARFHSDACRTEREVLV